MTRDSGWAGIPVEAYEKKQSCILLADRSMDSKDILNLIVESQSLIRHQFRWDIMMAVRCWHPFEGKPGFWSVYDRGTQPAIDSMHRQGVLRVDLTGKLNQASGKFSREARSGNWIALSQSKSSDSSPEITDDEELKVAPLEDGAESASRSSSLSGLSLDSGTEKVSDSRLGGRKQASNSAQVRKTVADRSSATPPSPNSSDAPGKWSIVKAVAIALTLIVLGGVVWFGYRAAKDVANAMDFDPPAIPIPSPAVSATPNDELTSEQNSQTAPPKSDESNPLSSNQDETTASTIETNDETIEPTNLTSEMVRHAMSQASESLPLRSHQLSLPNDSPANLVLMSLPLEGVGLNTFLTVRLLTDRGEIVATPLEEEDGWKLQSLDSREHGASILAVPNDEGDELDLIWRWEANDQFSQEERNQWVAGCLDFILLGAVIDKVSIRLCRPVASPPLHLVNCQLNPFHIQLQHGSHLMRPKVFRDYRWQAAGLEFCSTQPTGTAEVAHSDADTDTQELDELWTVSSDGKVVNLRLDEGRLRERTYAMLVEKNKELETGLEEIVTQLLRENGPLGLKVKYVFEPDPAHPSKLKVVSDCIVEVDSERDLEKIRLADLTLPRKMTPETYRNALSKHLAEKLMEYFEVKDRKSVKIIESGGKGSLRASNQRYQAALAMAGVFHNLLMDLLESDVQLQIERRGGEGRAGFIVDVAK